MLFSVLMNGTAAQYAVQGFPTVLLLDGGGDVLARSSGFMPPRQFIDWLEESLQRFDASL